MLNSPPLSPMIPVQPVYGQDGAGESGTHTTRIGHPGEPAPRPATAPQAAPAHAPPINAGAVLPAPVLAAATPASPPIWEHTINLYRLLSPTPITEPTAAGRPDVIVIDRALASLRAGQWRHWEDASRCFRQVGLRLPKLRRVMVPRGSALAHDIRTGLAYEQKKLAAGLTLAHPFYAGDNKGDAHAVCSLIRLGLTHVRYTRQLAHYMAQIATEPDAQAGADGISLVDRLNLLRDLFEQPWQIGAGETASLMRPAYAPGTYLTEKNDRGQTPLDVAVLTNNQAMETALRQLTGQPVPAPSEPMFPPMDLALPLIDEWFLVETGQQDAPRFPGLNDIDSLFIDPAPDALALEARHNSAEPHSAAGTGIDDNPLAPASAFEHPPQTTPAAGSAPKRRRSARLQSPLVSAGDA